MVWLEGLAIAAVLLVLAWMALSRIGASRWSRATDTLHAQLEAARTAPAVTRFDARELDGLPAPVQRYFRAVLVDGQPVITAATVVHQGRFDMGENIDRWTPFTSRQRVITRRPGFVWDARMPMLPGLEVFVHDAYVAGIGILRPAIQGLVTLMELHGTGDVAEGELMRWFAEAAWYPTALLPSQGVHWEAVDEHSARATLVDGAITLTLTFGFGADGLIETVRAQSRGRTVAGRVVPTPWEGRWSDVRSVQGMRVPMTGEVAWLTPEGRKPYWRGTITELRHEFAR